MIVVSDTTPLISLMKASQLQTLQGLFGEILIPEAVYDEGIITAEDARAAIEKLRLSKRWISKDLLDYALSYIGEKG